MLENRPIVAITIGYVIGIIMGLYFKISIVLFYFILFIFLILKKPHKNNFKLISFKRYFRYIKLFINKKVFIIILSSSILSNTIVLYKNIQYKNYIKKIEGQTMQLNAEIISNGSNKKYKKIYTVQVKNKRFNISVDKKIQLQCGDFVFIKGIFIKPKQRTNYKGFDYKEYLKSKGIYGTIDCNQIEILKKNNNIFNKIFLRIKNIFQYNFDKDVSSLLSGTVLGFKDEISEDIKKEFEQSNISHILAVSGMHIGYLILFCSLVLDKTIGKKSSKVCGIIVLILYIKIIGYPLSAVRAEIMAIMVLSAKLIYRKSDVWTNLSFSLLILLIFNPFSIKDIGLLLSFMATLGIIIYTKSFKCKNRLYNVIGITISATILLIPILAIYFNKVPIFSLCISLIVGVIAGPIFVLGLIYIILSNFFKLNIIKYVINLLVRILLFVANLGSKIPLNQINVITPNFIEIFMFYSMIFIVLFLISIYKQKRKHNKVFKRRIKNLISLAKFEFNQNKKGVISILIIVVISIGLIRFFPSDLKMYFIDVGQGDSCLIVTPNKKKILIDGGGSETYDVGKNVLVPYLLARRISHIDYIIISHFDTDHIGGILTVMEEMKVDKVIISKQGELSKNYEKFENLVNKKQIEVIVVENGDKINIEKDVHFEILWPDSSNLISENILNNNSIVCKLHYKNFTCLFTGDIEEIAEKRILETYKNNINLLNSTVLKVGHHGSKTSSIQEFLNYVKPKIALIGVAVNNTFGHPSNDVLERLKICGCAIYRTDKQGEIIIIVNNTNQIKVRCFVNN